MTGRSSLTRLDISAAVEEAPRTANKSSLDLELGNGFDLGGHLDEIRKHYLERGMEEAGGQKKKAAELLGFENWQTMDKQLKKFNVN